MSEVETKRKNAGLVSLWLGEELKADVREACEARGYSQSGLARMLFGQWLSRHEGKRIKKRTAGSL
jgi:hypothetical protein